MSQEKVVLAKIRPFFSHIVSPSPSALMASHYSVSIVIITIPAGIQGQVGSEEHNTPEVTLISSSHKIFAPQVMEPVEVDQCNAMQEKQVDHLIHLWVSFKYQRKAKFYLSQGGFALLA